MACGCRKLLVAFAERLARWEGLRVNRPNIVTELPRCTVCGRVWKLEFRAIPDG